MEKYYVAVISAPKHIGVVSVRKLLDYFGNAESVWFAESAELEQAGLSKTGLQSFLEFREKNPYAPEKLIDYCDANGIGLCSISRYLLLRGTSTFSRKNCYGWYAEIYELR